MKNKIEHTNSCSIFIESVFGIGLLVALGLLPYYCESFMTWMYILVVAFLVVALSLVLLHFRSRDKKRKENHEAMMRNPERIDIFRKLGRGNDITTTGDLDYPLLRHHKGYDASWVYNSTREAAYFTLYVKEKYAAAIRQEHDSWLSRLAQEDTKGFEMIINISSFDDNDNLLDGLNLMIVGFRTTSAMSFGRIESLLLKTQVFVDSLSPYYMYRQFCLKKVVRGGLYVDYYGLTLVSALRQTSKGMEDAWDCLPCDDFKRVDSMLTWVRYDDMVYIDSWEDVSARETSCRLLKK